MPLIVSVVDEIFMKLPIWIFVPLICCTAAAEGLTRQQAEELVKKDWAATLESLTKERADEMKNKSITIGDKTMPFLEKTVGAEPEGGRPLFISMHGGGSAPPQVNDQQWKNQIKLYNPEGSLYIAPRAPTNTWNLWSERHIEPLYDRLIANCVALHKINPNKVYIMGYSAGGDGVYQLGPRMADRWAACAMMAGHPNGASMLNMRNTPMAIQVGGQDAAFKRNEVCKNWAEKLDVLEKENPGFYPHFFKSYPECGHWMNLQDAVAVPWMLKFTRNPWPKSVTWELRNVVSPRFFWLAVDEAMEKNGQVIEARCQGQTISLTSKDVKVLTLRLSDELLKLDEPVIVEWNGKKVFSGVVARSAAAVKKSLAERADPATIATALLSVTAP